MKINEFTAKKLGEVLAFSIVGAETLERGRPALTQAFGESNLGAIIADLESQAQQIKTIAETAGVSEITLKKSQGTGTKLRAMRDLYVGEEWDNPAELLEWSGFFEGAAIVHWNLVVGAAETIDDNQLLDLATVSRDLHHELLIAAGDQLKLIGNQKAS